MNIYSWREACKKLWALFILPLEQNSKEILLSCGFLQKTFFFIRLRLREKLLENERQQPLELPR